MELFTDENDGRRKQLGKTKIEFIQSSGILTQPKGFVGAYDYTLNPYSGCSFGCNYCYAAFFSRTAGERENWGGWVKVKENALGLLIKYRKRPLLDKSIYISSVTDPYQPIEKELELTRGVLKELLYYHRPRLVIQTRSPLVTRDLDLFKKFISIQVNMTVTTDSEIVRKAFEPLCPSNELRLKAIKELTDNGIKTCITMTPLLPINDPHVFANMLMQTGVKKFVIQPFHVGKGKFASGIGAAAIEQIEKMNWTAIRYREVADILKRRLPFLEEGKKGFSPV